ncbi:MAG: MqnA/MqnD/SBP family protein [Rhodothermales bacterium]
MRIAIWDEPALDVFAAVMEQGGRFAPSVVRRGTRAECRNWIVLGEVDVALVPTLTLFREQDLFDALPAVALSSWAYVQAEIILHKPLGEAISTVGFDPRYAQEVLLTQIVLKEHYNVVPGFKPVDASTVQALLDAPADATIVVNAPPGSIPETMERLDLGREWYELTNYPMVWGVFVTQRGAANTDFVRRLTTYAGLAEQRTEAWLEQHPVDAARADLYQNQLRYRLDDLAVASFTALQDYLYFYLATDDIAPVSFYEVPADEDDSDDIPLL